MGTKTKIQFEFSAEDVCPIEDVLEMIGGKWKVIILWWLQDRDLRFGELRDAMPGITQKMLTQQLRELESCNVVNREVFAQVPPKVIYSLTPLGHTLKPILQSLFQWSQEHREALKPTKSLEGGHSS